MINILRYIDTFKNSYLNHAKNGLVRYKKQPLLTEKDIQALPKPVQNYLRFAGVIGKPKIQNFWMKICGTMSPKPNGSPLPMIAEQYEFFDNPTRLFYITMNMYGIPAEALHLYIGPSATFRVRLAKLIPVVNAQGPKMNQSETVTLFNDMCIFAPATLIDKHIHWKSIDSHTVQGSFTNAGNTISATLVFGEQGELINFISNDRYMSIDGKKYQKYQWSTPVRDYKEYDGIKIASKGKAIWKTETGDFTYIETEITDLKYNVSQLI
jgi:hypothetical protein